MDEETKRRLTKAKKLIQEKRYDDAEALLITISDPLADEWLEKLSKVNKRKELAPEIVAVRQKDYTTKLIVLIVLYLFFIIPGIIAGSLWAGQARRDLKLANGYEIPNARNIIRLNRFLFLLILIALLLLLVYMVVVMIATR